MYDDLLLEITGSQDLTTGDIELEVRTSSNFYELTDRFLISQGIFSFIFIFLLVGILIINLSKC